MKECCENGCCKRYLSWVLVILLAVFAYASISYVRSYDKSIEPSSFRSFSTSGEGKVIVVPDVAQFSFKVTTEGGMDIISLQKENVDKMNAAIKFLKNNGIDEKDIKTLAYNLDSRYTTCNRWLLNDGGVCPPSKIVGYAISQKVQVKVRDFSKIGTVFAGVVEKGANAVSNLFFTVDDEDVAKAEARAEAIAEARAKAKAISKEAGFEVGRLLSINEGFSPRSSYKSMGMGLSEMAMDDAMLAPSIEAGSQEITVNVTLTYEIK